MSLRLARRAVSPLSVPRSCSPARPGPPLRIARYTTSTMPTVAAICQIRSTNDPVRNLAISASVIRDAVAAGATACFLPEAADFIATSAAEFRALSFPLSAHAYVQGLQAIARELGVVVSAGVHELPEKHEDSAEPAGSTRVFNTHVLIGADGGVLEKYRKLHLFDVELESESDGRTLRTGESRRIIPGPGIVPPVDVPGLGKVGLEICYDLRFPELQVVLTRMGAQVLTFPSAFTLRTGKDHWPTLCRAIAIQYQVYVLAAAQWGAHNPGRSSWGESLAFDPWGKPLGRLRSIEESEGAEEVYANGGEFFLCKIDTSLVGATRKQIPLAIQKRADVYGVVGVSGPK